MVETILSLVNQTEQLYSFANMSIQVAVAITAILALGLTLITLVGLREVRLTRKYATKLRRQLRRAKKANAQINERLAHLEDELESMVFVAHEFSEGENCYKSSDYEKAIQHYESALKLQPDNKRVLVRMSRAYINLGNTNRAAKLLEEMIDEQKTANQRTDPSVWLALSTAWRYRDSERAIDCVENALVCNPYDTESLNYLGLLLRDIGEYSRAIETHEECLEYQEVNPLTHFYLSLLYLKVGKHAEFEYHLERAQFLKDRETEKGRMKLMWSETIEWVYYRQQNTIVGDRHAKELSDGMKERWQNSRNLLTIYQHWEFYITALGIEPTSDDILMSFASDRES